MSERKFEPINRLLVDLDTAGNNLTRICGYLSALWHLRALDGFRDQFQIENAREAIAKVSAALDAYEATLKPKEEAAS